MIRKILFSFFVIIILTAVLTAGAFAEDIQKKWRLSFSVDNYTTPDEIRSDADNRAYYIDETETILQVGVDPRPDVAATNVLQIEDAIQMNVAGSYAFNSWFLLELRAGYSKADIGDIEITAWLANDEEAQQLWDEENEILMRWYPTPVGKLTRIPIQLSSVIRFRPKSNFNPYMGIGFGYVLTKFESSSEFDEFSEYIDQSVGAFRSALYPGGVIPADKYHDLAPASVHAPNYLEYHILGGLEYTFKKHWAVFIDAQYLIAARDMSIRVDGVEKFGIGFPDGEVELKEGVIIPGPFAQPYVILSGGGIDFDGNGKGDPGTYFVNGGRLKYGGFSLGIGIKYTF